MKTVFISELESGHKLDAEYFVLTDFKQALTKKGDSYYRLELADKTGRINAVVWTDNIPNTERSALEIGTIVALDATVESFQGDHQLNIQRLAKAKEYDESDFVETSKRDINEMWETVTAEVGKVENKDIKKVLEKLINTDEYSEKLKSIPAGVSIHHAFRGGLLEHLCEMFAIAESLYEFYPEADKDIVRAGILLHDIGKFEEMESKGTTFTYSVSGNLIGHLTQGVEIFLKLIPEDFPPDLKNKIIHIIVSHNGRLEFGSPIMPKTIEAAIVHSCDKSSSYVRQFQKHIENAKDSDQDFSAYDKFIETGVYLK